MTDHAEGEQARWIFMPPKGLLHVDDTDMQAPDDAQHLLSILPGDLLIGRPLGKIDEIEPATPLSHGGLGLRHDLRKGISYLAGVVTLSVSQRSIGDRFAVDDPEGLSHMTQAGRVLQYVQDVLPVAQELRNLLQPPG